MYAHGARREKLLTGRRGKEKKEEKLGRRGDENRWRNSVRNTEEKNKRHLLVKPNLVPPPHSSRVQPNAGAQTAAGPRRTPAPAHRAAVCGERAPPKVQFKCALAEPFFI